MGENNVSHTLRNRAVAAVVIGIAVLAGLFAVSNRGGSGGANPSSTSGAGAGRYKYAVGQPSSGAAPAINLPSTQGGTFSLAGQHGRTTLLYFQEGITCQPCWDQLKDLQSHMAQVKALGVDQVVSITTDPINILRQKASDEGLSTPVLSDSSLKTSTAYNANQYGMMGHSRDGHSFVLVGPDGRIEWRADYGGPPDYTMYVPVADLLADLRHGLDKS